jgi:hypothetical protein
MARPNKPTEAQQFAQEALVAGILWVVGALVFIVFVWAVTQRSR